MVVHDRENQQRWTEHRMAQEEKKKRTRIRSGRWSVLGVQSLACAALLLLAFLLKLAGGGAYEELKQSFRGALEENELMAVLSTLFEEEETGAKENDFTDAETQETQGVTASETAAVMRWWGGV